MLIMLIMEMFKNPQNNGFFWPTCEEAAVVLLRFLRRLKLLLGMFLWEFLPQVKGVLLFSEDKTSQVHSSEQSHDASNFESSY